MRLKTGNRVVRMTSEKRAGICPSGPGVARGNPETSEVECPGVAG